MIHDLKLLAFANMAATDFLENGAAVGLSGPQVIQVVQMARRIIADRLFETDPEAFVAAVLEADATYEALLHADRLKAS